MSYSLRRISDGAGDNGTISRIHRREPDGSIKTVEDARPTIGYAIEVGSRGARTYSHQDFWVTTVITDILEDEGNRVVFRTSNSVYEWTRAQQD